MKYMASTAHNCQLFFLPVGGFCDMSSIMFWAAIKRFVQDGEILLHPNKIDARRLPLRVKAGDIIYTGHDVVTVCLFLCCML
jgi:hypothetical protein